MVCIQRNPGSNYCCTCTSAHSSPLRRLAWSLRYWGGVWGVAACCFPSSLCLMAFRIPSRYLARVCKTSTARVTTGSTARAIHQHAPKHQHQHGLLPCSRQLRPPQQSCSPWGGQTRLKHGGKKGADDYCCVCALA